MLKFHNHICTPIEIYCVFIITLNKHKKKINMSIKSMFKPLYIAVLVLKVKKLTHQYAFVLEY